MSKHSKKVLAKKFSRVITVLMAHDMNGPAAMVMSVSRAFFDNLPKTKCSNKDIESLAAMVHDLAHKASKHKAKAKHLVFPDKAVAGLLNDLHSMLTATVKLKRHSISLLHLF